MCIFRGKYGSEFMQFPCTMHFVGDIVIHEIIKSSELAFILFFALKSLLTMTGLCMKAKQSQETHAASINCAFVEVSKMHQASKWRQ